MAPPTVPGVGAVYFDLYGTLLDLGPLDAACDDVVVGRGAAFASAWRAEQLRLAWLLTIARHWADFEAVTRRALRTTAARFGVPEASLSVLDDAFDRLPVRPEAPDTVDVLRRSGLRLGVLSNGSSAMLQRALGGTVLEGAFDDVLSVDAVGRYKPDPAVYGLAVTASGLTPDRIGFVSANDWDAAGAAAVGLRVAWLRAADAVDPPDLGPARPVPTTWAGLAGLFLD